MLVLGIESSCDETAAAIVENRTTIKSNIIASQIKTHAPFGGVVPELASREHLKNISHVVSEALRESQVSLSEIDGIAVTRGPGLIGSLLVGVSYAKSLAYVAKKPIVGVNHIEGHIYSVIFENPKIAYPAIALIVSGGHTTLFYIPGEGQYAVLGRTRDDAAGEAYDKVAKLLGLGYPGGPVIDRLAKSGNPEAAELVFSLPRFHTAHLDFSFSGLKTAVLRYVKENAIKPVQSIDEVTPQMLDLIASFQDKVVRSLISRVVEAVRRHQPKSVIMAGGVACNSALRAAIKKAVREIPVYYPSPILTTDNAAMIAAAGYAKLERGENDGLEFHAAATLKIENLILQGYEIPLKVRYKT
ncbi:MAG: tRNA (adenosine(37)-N6)-threonylcarbamoyltransferase complex transferase subunit TsaD [Acidobacteriota bacterium]